MNVMIVGWFGEHNIGDDLILDSIYEVVNRKLSPEKIYISSNQKVNKKYYWIYDHDFSVKSWLKLFLRGNIFHNVAAYKNSDIIIFSVGGGISDWNKVVIQRLITKINFFKKLKKKIFFIGVGAGPFVGNYSNDRLKYELNKVERILARDDTSYFNLKSLGLQNVIKTNDIVFENKYLTNLNKQFSTIQKKKQVSIIPAPLFYNNLWIDHEEKFKQYIKSLEDIINFLAPDYEVLVIPFQKEFDQNLLLNHLKNVDKFRILNYKNYDQVYAELKASEFTIPMRFHGMVLSVLFGTPMIPIIYDHKLADLSEKLEIKELALSIGDGVNWDNHVFTIKEFINSFNSLTERYDEIKEMYELFLSEVDKNGRFLEEHYE